MCLVASLPGEGVWLISVVSTHVFPSEVCADGLFAWRGEQFVCVYRLNTCILRLGQLKFKCVQMDFSPGEGKGSCVYID